MSIRLRTQLHKPTRDARRAPAGLLPVGRYMPADPLPPTRPAVWCGTAGL